MAAALEEKVRADAAKSCGCGNAAATLEKMFKGQTNHKLAGAWTDEKGRQCICDGFRGYRLHKALPLTQLDKDVVPFDLSKIIDPLETRENVPVNVPSVKEIKEFIALERAKSANGDKRGKKADTVMDLGRGLPAVNARYLLELLTVLPDVKVYAKKGGRLEPLYAVSERGDAIVLPVRTPEKEQADKLEKRAHDLIAKLAGKDGEQPIISIGDLALLADARSATA